MYILSQFKEKNRNTKPSTSTNSPFMSRPQRSIGVQRRPCPSWGTRTDWAPSSPGDKGTGFGTVGQIEKGWGPAQTHTLVMAEQLYLTPERNTEEGTALLSSQLLCFWPSQLNTTMPKPQSPFPLLPVSCPQFDQTPNLWILPPDISQ